MGRWEQIKNSTKDEIKEHHIMLSLSQASILDILLSALPRFLTYDEIAVKFPNVNCLAVYKICKQLRNHRSVDEVRVNGELYLGYDLQGREHKTGRKAKCKGCGADIRWGEMFGKPHPLNLDGSSHFDSCPNRKEMRKK